MVSYTHLFARFCYVCIVLFSSYTKKPCPVSWQRISTWILERSTLQLITVCSHMKGIKNG